MEEFSEELNKYREMPLGGYRSDSFVKDHTGKHIVFLGDSFTFGEGLEIEDTWAYKTYQKIKESGVVTDGFYNLGMSGRSIVDCIEAFFDYCSKFGNPEILFFMTTEIDRDLKRFSRDKLNDMVVKEYKRLEDYCVKNQIKIYSFSWVTKVKMYSAEPKRYLFKLLSGVLVRRPLWVEQALRQYELYDTDILNSLKSFHTYSNDEMLDRVYSFDMSSKDKEKSLWALDKVHPGTSFHDFYAEFIYGKFAIDNKLD